MALFLLRIVRDHLKSKNLLKTILQSNRLRTDLLAVGHIKLDAYAFVLRIDEKSHVVFGAAASNCA